MAEPPKFRRVGEALLDLCGLLFGLQFAVRECRRDGVAQCLPPLQSRQQQIGLAIDAAVVNRVVIAMNGEEYLRPPHRGQPHFDPKRNIKSWRTAWRRLTRAIRCAGCGLLQNPGETCSGCGESIANLKSPFAGFRFHDLRHQAITELAESKASDQTIMSIAGHVSKKMLQHYSHVRLEAKRDALTMGRGKQGVAERTKRGYDTNYDTKVPVSSLPMPQVIDSMVELSGIEPLTSSLRTRRSPN